MRPIKFRAWDKVERRLHYFDFFDIEKGKIDYVVPEIPGDRFLFNLHRADVMQFTGLLDKTGKEIYHKDIVRDADGNTYRVEWDDHDAEFYLAVKISITGFSNLTASLVKDMEVIGNIYENPELIK